MKNISRTIHNNAKPFTMETLKEVNEMTKNPEWEKAKYEIEALHKIHYRFSTQEDAQRYLGILQDGIKPKILQPSDGKPYENASFEVSFVTYPLPYEPQGSHKRRNRNR